MTTTTMPTRRKTATRAQVLARIAELGATFKEGSGGWDEFNVTAPDGYVWSECGSIHQLVNTYRPGPWGKGGFYADILYRMSWGIQPCAIEDCEWCGNVEAPEVPEDERA